MRGIWSVLRPFDWGALVLALAVAAGSAVLVYEGGDGDPRVSIRGEGGRWVFPRNAAETLAVPGPLGDTVLELRGGEVRVVSSPCLNQSCVAAGGIHAPGQWLACLPNRVFVTLEGREEEEGLDGLAW